MTVWTQEMKSAAMKDAATVCKQADRIAELEAALRTIYGQCDSVIYNCRQEQPTMIGICAHGKACGTTPRRQFDNWTVSGRPGNRWLDASTRAARVLETPAKSMAPVQCGTCCNLGRRPRLMHCSTQPGTGYHGLRN